MEIFSTFIPSVFNDLHPKEDYFVISKKYPIFAIADGVSLMVNEGEEYPKISGAGEVARIFCKTVIFEAEKRFDNFSERDLKEIFGVGNEAVKDYNVSQGRIEDTINYWDVDLFSATMALVVLKDNRIYWMSLCDCGVVVFNNGKNIFQSPNGWENFPKDWKEGKSDKEKVIERHRDYRNAVKDGKLVGYGAVNGQENAIYYLNTGVLNVKEGNKVLLYTDGFENYINLKEFIDIFNVWPKNIEEIIKNLVNDKGREDLSKYGREKSLIAVSI